MATMDNLNDEIRALQNNILEYETQLTNLLSKGNEGMNTEEKQLMIKYYSDRIIEKEKLIAAKEIEKEKRITMAKEVDAAKEIEKLKRITTDKARDERDVRKVTLKFGNSKSPDQQIAKSDITLLFLRDLALDSFPECIQKSFKIGYKTAGDSSILPFATDQQLADYVASAGAVITFWVASDCKGFSEFSLAEAVAYARAADDEPIVDDTKFPSEDFTDNNDTAIKGIVDHAVQDIMCKIRIFGPISEAQNEASVRELIGPVLVAAARIADEIKLICERKITGSRGAGLVDYAVVYKKFNVVITEAKKDDINSGLGQNIAQLVSAREDYLYRTAPSNNKRKFAEFAPDIASVPSFGAVSTAEKWVFTLYQGDRLYRTNAHRLPLDADSGDEDVRKGLLRVIGILVGVLNAQKMTVDANEYTRQKGPVRRLE